MSESIRQRMIDELEAVQNKRMTPERATICCPYHADTNPSATINLSLDKPVPLGWFGCWSCHKSVPWNTLAATLGLATFGKGKKKNAADYLDPKRFKAELLDSDARTETNFEREMNELAFFDLQADEWRGVSRKLLERVGTKLAYLDRTGDFYVWLPVMIDSELKGYVKATLEKAPDGESSYFNASGTWSKTHGLLFYDYAVSLAKRKGLNTVVLVEGPRDALRLLKYGIPAMSVLGALNWNEEKRYILEQSGIQNLVLFLDGDDAGLKATKLIYASCKTHFNIKKIMKMWRLRVPRINPKTGKQARKKISEGKYRLLWDNELDPGNCPIKHLREVKDALV